MFSLKVKFSQTILKTKFGLKIDLEWFQLPQLSSAQSYEFVPKT